jgi:hypothetical protein
VTDKPGGREKKKEKTNIIPGRFLLCTLVIMRFVPLKCAEEAQ